MEPLDRRLFALFSAAVGTGLEYVRKRRDENGYIGAHRDWPVLTWHDNGMPWLSERFEGPTDYADALRPQSYTQNPVATLRRFEQEGSFIALLEYARALPNIAEHLDASHLVKFQDQFTLVQNSGLK